MAIPVLLSGMSCTISVVFMTADSKLTLFISSAFDTVSHAAQSYGMLVSLVASGVSLKPIPF